jgi:hypothetical protein
MIASLITSRKRATRPCIMTSSLHQAQTPCPEKELLLFKILSPPAVAGAKTTITTTITYCVIAESQADLSIAITHSPLRTMAMDMSIALTRTIMFLPPSLLQRQRKVSTSTNGESCQQRKFVFPMVNLHS